jgi:hypothetical protein
VRSVPNVRTVRQLGAPRGLVKVVALAVAITEASIPVLLVSPAPGVTGIGLGLAIVLLGAVVDRYGPRSSVGPHRSSDSECPLWSDVAGRRTFDGL